MASQDDVIEELILDELEGIFERFRRAEAVREKYLPRLEEWRRINPRDALLMSGNTTEVANPGIYDARVNFDNNALPHENLINSEKATVITNSELSAISTT